MKNSITVLVAPLDWGLGHATRCIPLINHLLSIHCKVIIAAEGKQEKLLKSEFPYVTFVHLPGYRIRYTNIKRLFSLNIALQIPKILKAISTERKWLGIFLKNNSIDAVISDNRYGLHHPSIASIFITHQLHIKTPFSLIEKIIRNINFKLIEKFSACWVPDEQGSMNLAGILSHPPAMPKLPVAFIGGVSRLNKEVVRETSIDILFVLSGPEPQRTLFESIILRQLKTFSGKVTIVRGLPGNVQSVLSFNNVEIINHLPANELQKVFLQSEIVISRSGYTTVMDICKMNKKAILIPTPGQTEQEYLARHLQKQGWCLTASQQTFSLGPLLTKARNFNFQLPNLNMEAYKEILDDWVKKLKKEKYKEGREPM